jgi:tRNA-dihydrouridine synthase
MVARGAVRNPWLWAGFDEEVSTGSKVEGGRGTLPSPEVVAEAEAAYQRDTERSVFLYVCLCVRMSSRLSWRGSMVLRKSIASSIL